MVAGFVVVAFVLALAEGVVGHFALSFPPWRADSLSNKSYSQWNYPCAGVDYGAGNITDWPLQGGSLRLELHHKWTYLYVNLGLGRNATNFNVSLTPEFLNVTGKGTLCIDKLPIPVPVENGTLATLQVVTPGSSGSALYNCADIRLVEGAKSLDNCTNEGVSVKTVHSEQDAGASGNASSGQQAKGLAASTSAGPYTIALGTACVLVSLGLSLVL
ncbi:expression library immunization antigen 1 [Ophiocordyceps camponoti-floridani]|uniref:Expression library immunization antigen 1 n=1 Tax=Ophiocordyceps camponoti-floridani TaxID=2030778 RepID=A0A8H4VFM6_9HYPO|nr:expression library immunization antigen 1 [Ophiocordyceps camponoti-floridani]